MKKITVFYSILAFLLPSYMFCQTLLKDNSANQIMATAQFEQLIVATDGLGESENLYVGIDPTATDGKDVLLGETEKPPIPIEGFDARMDLGSTIYTWKDFRNGTQPFSGTHVHTLKYQLGEGSTGLVLNFTLPTLVGGSLTLKIKDPIGGFVFDLPYTAPGTYNFTHASTTGFAYVLVTLEYTAFIVPVELTSFTANTNGSQVKLNWKTATETNNRGFEIERKTKVTGWSKIGYIEGKGTTTESNEYTFIDKAVNTASGKLFYRLKQMDYDGSINYSEEVDVELIPQKCNLEQNYPNPFNPTTSIKYTLPSESKVKLEVFNVLGQSVKTLVNANQGAGYYETKFNAYDLPSGIYFSVLTVESVKDAAQFKSVKKMMLVK